MGYSLKEVDSEKKKQGSEFTYFSQQDWESYPFASNENMQWFRDARYGLFLHVGISAIGMVDISWTRATHKLPDPPTFGKTIPDHVYDSWSKELSFPKFNAQQWAHMAKKGGLKYVVIIAKHHDGFHLWDTQFSEYKITNSPYKKDYLKQLIDAFRNEGIKIGIYYSKRDWVHPDYEPVPVKDATAINKPPFFKMNEGKQFYITDKHKKYQEYMLNTVRELMTNYGKIDLLWWDATYNAGMFPKEMWNSCELESMVRALQPHIIINNRAGLPGDFDTPEGHTGFFQNSRMWETCMPLGKAWSYSESKIKRKKRVLMQLLNCVGGDGNYLLSVGCKPDGSIADNESKRLLEIGAWLEKYGESVYGTRGGIWKPTKKYVACFKENTIYLHIFSSFPIIKLRLPFEKNILKSAVCMTCEKSIVKVKNGKISLTVFGKKICNPVTIIKIELNNKPIMEN